MARDPRPDRPSLDPEFVASQTFSTSFRGFDTAEVRGYLEVIAGLLRDGEVREEELTRQLADAQERLAHPPPLDEHQLTVLLGEETTRVIETARHAASEIRSKAEENAARLVREAIDEAAASRSSAEENVGLILAELERETAAQRTSAEEYASQVRGGADEEVARRLAEADTEAGRMRSESQAVLAKAELVLAERTEEAEVTAAAVRAEVDGLRTEVAVEVEALRTAAAEEIAEQRAASSALAEAEVEAARQEGRAMVAEARSVRERMLTDLVERRRLGRAQLEQLRGTRQWMLEVLESARTRIDQAAGDLAGPLESDRAATEEPSPQDLEDDALLQAMMKEPEPGAEPPEVEETVADAEPETARAVVVEREDPGEPDVVPAEPDPVPSESEAVETSDEPAAETGEHAGEGNIDALFAKIRASRAGDVDRAHAVLVDLTEPPPESVPAPVDAPATEAPAPDLRTREARAQFPPVEAPDQVASLLERRDAATDQIERSLARRLKRILSDEQNELLDEVRRARGAPTAAVILPELAAHAARYADASADDLAGAAASGASFYGESPTKVSTKVDDIAERLSDELVRQLRGRLTRSFSDAEGDESELGERIRACYREWKTQRIADTSRHFVLAAFTRGLFDASPSATSFRWIVDDGGTPCPDAEDNALQGQVAKGDPYPTGDVYPPAHPGCRCLIVPVEAAVISGS